VPVVDSIEQSGPNIFRKTSNNKYPERATTSLRDEGFHEKDGAEARSAGKHLSKAERHRLDPHAGLTGELREASIMLEQLKAEANSTGNWGVYNRFVRSLSKSGPSHIYGQSTADEWVPELDPNDPTDPRNKAEALAAEARRTGDWGPFERFMQGDD
jgi:hypothetical protein